MADKSTETLHEKICRLRREREVRKDDSRRSRKQRLTQSERVQILKKTDGNCHICGGKIVGEWQADHVKAHSGGGQHAIDNYLPAHGTCNNYRWDYLDEEFQLILKLGVWARTQIQKSTRVGREIESGFIKHEERRVLRRKSHSSDAD